MNDRIELGWESLEVSLHLRTDGDTEVVTHARLIEVRCVRILHALRILASRSVRVLRLLRSLRIVQVRVQRLGRILRRSS